jgi:hypothetical protein
MAIAPFLSPLADPRLVLPPAQAGAAINAPIDEYDEARQDEWEQSLDEKFPWLRQCRDAVQQREEIGQ